LLDLSLPGTSVCPVCLFLLLSLRGIIRLFPPSLPLRFNWMFLLDSLFNYQGTVRTFRPVPYDHGASFRPFI